MPDAVPVEPSTEGAILAIGPEGVIGWGWHRGRPAEPLRVVLSIGGNPVAGGFADRFDLVAVRAQIGPGAPGFALRLPQWPRDAYPLEIVLRDGQGHRLGAPFRVAAPEHLAPACDAERLPMEGSLDRLEDGRLLGWAWDPNRPETALQMELLDGGEVLSRTVADLAREDLRAADKRGGRCGFAFDLPAALIDGRPHGLHVRAAGTNWEVPNGPVAFGPSRLPELLDEVARLRRDVGRLSAQIEQLCRPDSALMRDILGSLHERAAMMAEIQRDAVEREMDALRRFHFMPVPLVPDDAAPGEAATEASPATPPADRVARTGGAVRAGSGNDASDPAGPVPAGKAPGRSGPAGPSGGAGDRRPPRRAPRPPAAAN